MHKDIAAQLRNVICVASQCGVLRIVCIDKARKQGPIEQRVKENALTLH